MTALAAEPVLETGQSIEELPLASITPAPDNPRRDLGDITELADSMGELGMLQPLVVTPRKGKFMVVCGHRRYAAAKHAKLATAPAIVRGLNEPQRIKAMLIENCQRADLGPLEEARAYAQLVDLGLTQRQIAGDVGKTQSHVSKRVALLELTPTAQAELDSGGITIEDARDLLALKDMPKRLDSALKEGKRNGFERAVREELAAHELAEKVGASVQKLKQDGVRIVEHVKAEYDYYGPQLPRSVAKLVGRNGYDWNGELKIDPKTHAKEPCHAAAVDPRTGEIIYVCTKPASHKGATGAASATTDEKAAAAKERQRERAKALKAREEKKLAAPKIDARNMRLLADVLLENGTFGNDVARRGLRYVDEDSQTVVTRKDGSVSRIVHASDAASARQILDDRLAEAKTPEEIMGVVLQAFVAACYADTDAVPPSQRYDYVGVFEGARYYEDDHTRKRIRRTIDAIAGPIAKSGKSS